MAETLTIHTASGTEVVKIAVPGPQGPSGQGVPVGGSTGQVLRKASGTNYDTEWAAAGSGSGSVTSVALASTDLTISGSPITDSGTITANIAANAVTLEKLQTISSEHLLGRHGSGNGGVQQIGLGTGLAISGSNVGVTFGSSAGTACEGNDARLSDSRAPSLHSASHASAGSDPVSISSSQVTDATSDNTPSTIVKRSSGGAVNVGTLNCDNFATPEVAGSSLSFDASGINFDGAAISNTRANLGLGTAATADIGTGSTEVAAGNHTHELTALAATGAASGTILTANGSGGVTFAAASGGGSGGTKTYATFTAEHNQPPSTAFATLDTRNSIAVLDFDAATDENAVFLGIMPEAASLGNGLIVRLNWLATSATSGNVRWGVQFERSNTDLDADSFAAAVEANGAANGTSGILTTTAITVTDIDGITAGDVFRLKVYRNADDATNDTMTGDAELVAVEVRSAA